MFIGFRVQRLGFRVSGFRVHGLGFMVKGSGFQGFGACGAGVQAGAFVQRNDRLKNSQPSTLNPKPQTQKTLNPKPVRKALNCRPSPPALLQELGDVGGQEPQVMAHQPAV